MAKRDEKGSRIFDYEGYRPAGKDFQPPAELDDLTEILETGVERIKKNNGRPCSYPCTKEGLQKLAEACAGYIDHLNRVNSAKGGEDQQRLLPDYEGMCVYCGVSRRTMLTYEKTRPPEWGELIDYYKTLIMSGRKQLSSLYKISPTLELVNWVNNYDYRNTSEFKLTAQNAGDAEKTAVLENELDESGLVWDEERGEYIPADEGSGEL